MWDKFPMMATMIEKSEGDLTSVVPAPWMQRTGHCLTCISMDKTMEEACKRARGTSWEKSVPFKGYQAVPCDDGRISPVKSYNVELTRNETH